MSPAVTAAATTVNDRSSSKSPTIPRTASINNNAASLSRIAMIKTAFEKAEPSKLPNNNSSSDGRRLNKSPLRTTNNASSSTQQNRTTLTNGNHKNHAVAAGDSSSDAVVLLSAAKNGEIVSRITSKLQELSTTTPSVTSIGSDSNNKPARPAVGKKPAVLCAVGKPPSNNNVPNLDVNGNSVKIDCISHSPTTSSRAEAATCSLSVDSEWCY